MKQEDYLSCNSYEDQAGHPTKEDFTVFYEEDRKLYFFAMVDANGKVLLKSEGYPTEPARDTGIESVIKNRTMRERFSIKEDDDKSYLSLIAGNNQEIARSCDIDTVGEAERLLDTIVSGGNIEESSDEEAVTETLDVANTDVETKENVTEKMNEQDAGVSMEKSETAQAKKENIVERDTLISLQDLRVYFDLGGGGFFDKLIGGSTERRIVKAVDGVTFDIKEGETLGLVGESGCGKSTLGKALLRLTPITGGKAFYKSKDIANMNESQLREQRKNLQMIFQDPYASLNPRMTVGNIIGEPIRTFGLADGKSVENIVKELMETVGLSRRFIKRYPHEFSGGQRQRIGIARALAVDPDFIVADEPISALDVSIQAQIMNLMDDLQKEKNLTYLFISHDLRAVRHVADRVAVMYLGEIVELAEGQDIYQEPLHPYSKALISAVPVPDPEIEAKRERIILTGDVPSPINPPSGCHFHTRCPYAIDDCKKVEPKLEEIKPNHFAACIRISKENPHIEDIAEPHEVEEII